MAAISQSDSPGWTVTDRAGTPCRSCAESAALAGALKDPERLSRNAASNIKGIPKKTKRPRGVNRSLP
jgi:hypothetical protein